MRDSNAVLRVNPGGGLKAAEVVGRDDFVAAMWRTLERQSILLTAERRMGKTSVLRKMHADPPLDMQPIKRSLQGIASPDEFVRALIADTEAALPGLLKRSLRGRLQKAGIKRIDISPFGVEFEPLNDQCWKDVVTATLEVLDREVDVSVVFLWDELPHMIASIRDNQGPLVARQLLDLLRALRESHRSIRMVFSGSLGLHHVVDGLRAQGGMWVPTHDLLVVDLPPLLEHDAGFLAGELLRNEQVDCAGVERVAQTIAREVDGAPYYVHHTVHQLHSHQAAGRCGTVDLDLARRIIADALSDPQDPWQVKHYVDRVGSYYGDDARFVKAILDVVAAARAPLPLQMIQSRIGAHLAPPPPEHLHDLLTLLCKDHYLRTDHGYRFSLDLVRRAWLARRP